MKIAYTILIALLACVMPGCSSLGLNQVSSEPARADQEIVVLLHGLARTPNCMVPVAKRLEQEGYHVELIGYHSLTQTPEGILEDISKKIDDCCANHNAKVNFVGYSLGGLLVRAYLEKHEVKHLGRVVLMGTPNQGSKLVDFLKPLALFLGPTAVSLGTGEGSFPSSLEAPDYPVGIIAGTLARDVQGNDSAVKDGNDGLVSVESTQLQHMTDFVVVKTGHWGMPGNKQVINEVVAFLKDGSFSKPGDQPHTAAAQSPSAPPAQLVQKPQHAAAAEF